MRIRDFIPPIMGIIYNKFRRKKQPETRYTIGNIEIELSPNHDLPRFQSKWRLYDRFLPVLVKYLEEGRTIVDVGANIGDTAIAIMQNTPNPIKCIEPSDMFYPLLERNLSKWKAEDRPDRITLIKKLIGTGTISGALEHTKGGTAKIKHVEHGSADEIIPMDALADQLADVGLIKVDTDGYDFDVLQSAKSIISESKPILFWENFIPDEFQLIGYQHLYANLKAQGYTHVWVFDNFGNLILSESSFETLENLNGYLLSMEKFACTRTLYYADVLACTEKDRGRVERAVGEYKNQWINKSNDNSGH